MRGVGRALLYEFDPYGDRYFTQQRIENLIEIRETRYSPIIRDLYKIQ